MDNPFEKKSKRGRKFKISPVKYASYIVFEIVTGNHPYRDMELGSELYVDNHIDHSTLHKNFLRIPYDYLVRLLEATAKLLESLLGNAFAYLADSTGIRTKIYYDSQYQGKAIRRLLDYKLHTLVGYYPDKAITYVKSGIGSDKHTSDAKGASIMLGSYDLDWAYFSADSGYDFECAHKAIKEKGLSPLVKPRKNKVNRAKITAKHREWFSERLYRELRHIIETIFGGLENKGLLFTRNRREDCINKYSLITLIRHNLQTYFKLKVYIYLINRQTRKNRKLYILIHKIIYKAYYCVKYRLWAWGVVCRHILKNVLNVEV